MEPTYQDKSFALCWRFKYSFSQPNRSDVIAVRFSGRKVMLLKRIVALPGDTVEFRKGFLYINGNLAEEPYVKYRSNWELPIRQVSPGHVYVVGDNREGPMNLHKFGEIEIKRIIGSVLP